MSGHQAQVPPRAAEYFARLGITEHPVITRAYGAPDCWRRYPFAKRVSASWLRKMRAEGVTAVTLSAGGHHPDFTVAELLRAPVPHAKGPGSEMNEIDGAPRVTFQTSEPVRDTAMNVTARTWGDLIRQIRGGIISYDVPYQRGNAWSREQRILLIYSVLSGTPVPALIINERPGRMWSDNRGRILRAADGSELPCCAVIDGKQRLVAVRMWMSDELEVPASWFPAGDVIVSRQTDDGPYVRYSDLARRQGRFFENRAVPVGEAHVGSVAEEAAIYLRVNGSGTPQSDEDIERATGIAGRDR